MNTGLKKSKLKLDANELRLGEVSGLHGVKGWVKIFSDTQPRENIFDYQPWTLHSEAGKQTVEILNWRSQSKTLIAQLRDVNDREQARALIGASISIDKARLPLLGDGEFYWNQLIGLRVKSLDAEPPVDLGRVDRLMETGANDVLVVVGDDQSLDRTERLIPWVPGQVVVKTDLPRQEILVNWDPAF